MFDREGRRIARSADIPQTSVAGRTIDGTRRLVSTLLLLAVFWPAMASALPPDSPTGDDRTAPRVGRGDRIGISGRVMSAHGRPMHGVVVLVRSLDQPAVAIPELANATDRAGRYFWPLPAGRYRLTFVAEGTTIAERDVTVAGGRRPVRVDVFAARRRGS